MIQSLEIEGFSLRTLQYQRRQWMASIENAKDAEEECRKGLADAIERQEHFTNLVAEIDTAIAKLSA